MTSPSGASFGNDAVSSFEYNFDTWLDENEKRGMVTIPEPSDAQVRDFLRDWYILADETRNYRIGLEKEPENESPEARSARVAEEFTEQADYAGQISERRRQLIAAVCSNEPSPDVLRKLPSRVQQAFTGYVIGKLAPEA